MSSVTRSVVFLWDGVWSRSGCCLNPAEVDKTVVPDSAAKGERTAGEGAVRPCGWGGVAASWF